MRQALFGGGIHLAEPPCFYNSTEWMKIGPFWQILRPLCHAQMERVKQGGC